MGVWNWLSSWYGPPNQDSVSSARRTYVGATYSRRAGDMPYVRVTPQELVWSLPILRARAKWLARNNPHGTAAARDLPAQIVDTGILPSIRSDLWKRWIDDPRECDAARRLSLVGLQWLAARCVMVSGEAFIIRRPRVIGEPDVLPLRLEVLDGDALLEGDLARPARGNFVDQGIEFGQSGQPQAYWFCRASSSWRQALQTFRVPASDVIHLMEPTEPGMRRGVTWFAPVIMPLMQYGSFTDATLAAKDLAGRLTIAITDPDGSAQALGGALSTDGDGPQMQPASVIRMRTGEHVDTFDPPTNRDLEPFARLTKTDIAAGFGMSPEDITGDYSGMNFSQAKKSGHNQWRRIRGHRSRWLMPGMRRVERWCAAAAEALGQSWERPTYWSNPQLPMVDPDREGNAAMRQVRSGIRLLSDVIRDRGLDPDEYFAEMAAERELIRSLGLTLDSMPDQTTQSGQLQAQPADGPRSVASGGER